MSLTRLSTKGQLILPKEVRDRLGLRAGSQLEIEVRDGLIMLRPIQRTTVEDLIGLLPWHKEAKTLEEMDQAIARGAQEDR